MAQRRTGGASARDEERQPFLIVDGGPPNSEKAIKATPSGFSVDQLEASPVLQRLSHRDDFTLNRWRCIWNEKRAVQTLTSWARLDVDLLKARNLNAPADSYILEPTSDSVVKVFLNDEEIYKTDLAKRSLTPQWKHKGFLDVVCTDDMVRLHVFSGGGSEANDVGLGFVEFSAADVPYDQVIEGWMELRFNENLQQTSRKRYNKHCKTRDSDDAQNLDAMDNESLPSSLGGPPIATLERQSTNALPTTMYKKKAPTRSMFACTSCKCQGPATGKPHLFNAGEIFVRLRLTRAHGCTATDEMFARALGQPPMTDFGRRDLSEAAAVSQDSLQSLWDDGQSLKITLYNDAFISSVNYILFILQWTNPLLSLFLILAFLIFSMDEWLHATVFFMVVGVMMVLNSFPSVREHMTQSGANAPLNEVGFQMVARMASSDQMEKFIERVVEVYLSTSKKEPKALKVLSSRCFREGVPLCTFDELVDLICSPKVGWVDLPINPVTIHGLVLVDERRCATVKSVQLNEPGTEHMWAVEYDDDKGKVVNVEIARIRGRARIPNVPTYLLPVVVDTQCRRVRFRMGIVKEKALPILVKIADILAWRSNVIFYSRAIAVFSFCASGGLFLSHEWFRICTENTLMHNYLKSTFLGYHCLINATAIKEIDYSQDTDLETWLLAARWLAGIAMGYGLDHGFATAITGLGVFILLKDAKWMKPIKGVFRIIKRSLNAKRKAPGMWAFFLAEPGDMTAYGQV